jgi:phosphoribosyl 1,2-cyclic phosphodiesterase
MASDFSLTFYGCRGSIPVSGDSYTRYGGSTPCVVVHAGSRDIVLDAGSGIVDYSRDLLEGYGEEPAPIQTDLFITHLHLDHLIGLPFFKPIYMPDTTLRMWGPPSNRFGHFEEAIDCLIKPPFFPVALFEMQSVKTFHDIADSHVVYFLEGRDEPVQLRPNHPRDREQLPDPDDVEIEVHCMRGYNHPKSGVFIYKVLYGGKTLVYATDTEGFVHGDRRLMHFARGADVLIHDAMYTDDHYISMPEPTQGYGHSTVEIASALADKAGVDRLFFFHHDPASTDDRLDEAESIGKSLFANSAVARDGLTVEI